MILYKEYSGKIDNFTPFKAFQIWKESPATKKKLLIYLNYFLVETEQSVPV